MNLSLECRGGEMRRLEKLCETDPIKAISIAFELSEINFEIADLESTGITREVKKEIAGFEGQLLAVVGRI